MEDKNIDTGHNFVGVITRVIALLLGLGLFIADRYLHVIDPPVDGWIYGMLASVAMGNEQALSLIGMGKKH